jgi:hypothetical protein
VLNILMPEVGLQRSGKGHEQYERFHCRRQKSLKRVGELSVYHMGVRLDVQTGSASGSCSLRPFAGLEDRADRGIA